MNLSYEECEARSEMWASLYLKELGEGWHNLTATEKKRFKRKYCKMYNIATPGEVVNVLTQRLTADQIANFINPPNIIRTFNEVEVADKPCPNKPLTLRGHCFEDALEVFEERHRERRRAANKEEKEQNMYVEQNMKVTEKTTEDTRREHFLLRIACISSEKDEALLEKYGFRFSTPKSPKELVEWIKSGDFSFTKNVDEDNDEWDTWNHPIHGIRWTKVKEDKKGLKEAREKLNSSRRTFEDEIWAEVDPANFPKILEKFSKEKLH